MAKTYRSSELELRELQRRYSTPEEYAHMRWGETHRCGECMSCYLAAPEYAPDDVPPFVAWCLKLNDYTDAQALAADICDERWEPRC